MNAVLALHERVPNHGRYSEDKTPCDKWCDHSRADGYVCAECRTYTGDHVDWPCRTIRALSPNADTEQRGETS